MIASKDDKKIIKKTIEIALNDGMFCDKKIVIFGCTLYARDIRNILDEKDLKLEAIIDNNEQKAGKKCLGVMVYTPYEYFSAKAGNSLIIIASKYSREMIYQLKKMGLEEQSILNIPISEILQLDNDSDECFYLNTQEVEKGYNIYNKFKEKYPNAEKIFLCPYHGTGDVYMACIFLTDYLSKLGIKEYVLIVQGNNCRKVASIFKIDNIENIDSEEQKLLLKAWEFLGDEIINLKPLLYWGWRTKRYLYADKHPQITFMEMFKYDVFGFEKEEKPCPPQLNKESNYAVRLFKELNLKKEKTVILAPYAGSFVSEIRIEEWESLTKKLQKMGYDVCTNCYGEEMPIENTIPIQFPYDEIENVLEYAGSFVAIRSGLCDIASTAKCRMIIWYENGFNASKIEYFGLRNMKLNLNAYEFVYEEQGDLVKKTLSCF